MGGPGSGRLPKNPQAINQNAEQRNQAFVRLMDQLDPEDDQPQKRERIRRVWLKVYQVAISDGVSNMKAAEQILDRYHGKAVQPVAMEVSTRTPEERAAAFMEALDILKNTNADKAMKQTNGSESIN